MESGRAKPTSDVDERQVEESKPPKRSKPARFFEHAAAGS